MSTKAVMLKRDWPGKFHRSVFEVEKDPKTGEETRTFVKQLVFEPGVPQELDSQEYLAVKGDLNNSLVEVNVDKDGIARVVMSDKEREELLLANAEKGREFDEMLKKCVELEKQVETLQATVQEQADTITRQSEEIASLEEEILSMEGDGDEEAPVDPAPVDPASVEALDLKPDVIEIVKAQGLDTIEKLRDWGASHGGQYEDLDQVGKSRSDAIIAALEKVPKQA